MQGAKNIDAAKHCFVIMPFSQTERPKNTAHLLEKDRARPETYWTDFYENFLSKAVKDLGYSCERSEAASNNIVHSIVDKLSSTAIVLAVLTDLNPNVWYELGVRHSIARGTIMLMEKGQPIPFDISNYGVLRYEYDQFSLFKEELRGFLSRLENGKIDSPVVHGLKDLGQQIIKVASNIEDTPLSTKNLVKFAQKDIFIIGQNLFSMAKNTELFNEFKSILTERKDLTIRIMIVDPNQKFIIQALNKTIDKEFGRTLIEAVDIFKNWKYERLKIKSSSIIGNFSVTFMDANTPFGMLAVRPTIFKSHPEQRPAFVIMKQHAPVAFSAYYSSFNQEWNHAKPVN